MPDLPWRPPPRVKPRDHALSAGTIVFRSHSLAFGPVYFGNRQEYRFDCPDGNFGVLYAAETEFGAFSETFMREPQIAMVSESDLTSRGVSTLRVTRSLRLLEVMGSGLNALGVTSLITSSPQGQYAAPQSLSKWAYHHANGFDGIAFIARHDNQQVCYALFDKCLNDVIAVAPSATWAETTLLARMLDKYPRVAVVP